MSVVENPEGNPQADTPVARKTRIRGGHRTHLKKLLGVVDASLKAYDPSKEAGLMAQRDHLKRKAVVLSQLDEEILATLADDAIDDEIEATENIQVNIQNKISEIDVMLKRAADAKVKVENKETAPTATVPIVAEAEEMKLPKFEVPEFWGDPKDYRAFWEAFEVAVGNKTKLSKVSKFTYLKKYLAGDAATSIRGLELTDANYDEAVAILKKRFGNKQVIIRSHMEDLTHLPGVTEEKDTKKLRHLYDQIEGSLRSLKGLGVKPDQYGSLLVPILIGKIPDSLNLHISRKFTSDIDVWKVDDVMKEFCNELEARERCVTSRFTPKQKQKADPTTMEAMFTQWMKDRYGDTTSMNTMQNEPQNVSCAFCDGSHYSDQCRTVTDISKRKEILKKKRRCFLCTKPNHVANSCSSTRKCFKCRGKHHTSICDGRKSKDEKKDEKGEPKKEDKKEEKPDADDNTTTVVATSTAVVAASEKRTTILLQTAKLEAHVPPPPISPESPEEEYGRRTSIPCEKDFVQGSV